MPYAAFNLSTTITSATHDLKLKNLAWGKRRKSPLKNILVRFVWWRHKVALRASINSMTSAVAKRIFSCAGNGVHLKSNRQSVADGLNKGHKEEKEIGGGEALLLSVS